MSDINNKDKSNEGFSDVNYAKIVAALIGVEYPGDEYFDGTITSKTSINVEEEIPTFESKEVESPKEQDISQEIQERVEEVETTPVEEFIEETVAQEIQEEQVAEPIQELSASDNLPQEIEEKEISPVLVETPQQERVRSTPFRKQSYSQWQSARLRNFAKAGILLSPELNQESEEKGEVLSLDDEDVITVDSILAGENPTLVESEEKQDETLLDIEQKEESNENESQSLVEEISSIESVEEQIEPVIPIAVPISSDETEILEEEDEDEDVVYEYVYDYDEPRDITVMAKTSKVTKEPPVLPELKEEKPFFFAKLEEKPQKIKRKNNAPLIIPADSESVGFAPKGNKYR